MFGFSSFNPTYTTILHNRRLNATNPDVLSFRHKKTPVRILTGVFNRSLTMTYSHMGTPTLPSALNRFTSEFGMGSGGSNSLWSSGKTLSEMICDHLTAILRVFNISK
jgi:hypothetical protein